MKQGRFKLIQNTIHAAEWVAQDKEWEPQLHVTSSGKKADPEGWRATIETLQNDGDKAVADHSHVCEMKLS